MFNSSYAFIVCPRSYWKGISVWVWLCACVNSNRESNIVIIVFRFMQSPCTIWKQPDFLHANISYTTSHKREQLTLKRHNGKNIWLFVQIAVNWWFWRWKNLYSFPFLRRCIQHNVHFDHRWDHDFVYLFCVYSKILCFWCVPGALCLCF